jgi:hypothetical protein
MPATVRFICIALLIALAAQVVLYWPTFHQLPFGDDWGPPLSEVNRGRLVGPLSFFTETRQPDSYRPLQSLFIWLFGRSAEPANWVGIRVLHFLSSAVALVVVGLLLKQWKFGRAGVVVAAAVSVLHPTLVAPVGSIDGFSSILSCAAVWWGVWMMGLTERPAVGIALACLAMIVGTHVKEYAFAMGPTAVLAAWFFYRPRWRSAIMTAVVMGVLTFFLLWVRRYTKPTDMELPPSDFDVDSVMTIAMNAVFVPVGGFFFGDSLWLYVERSPAAIGVALLIGLVTMVLLGVGMWRTVSVARASGTRNEDHVPEVCTTMRIVFLLLSIPAVTFPANAVMKISEMYLCGLVTTVALLAAIAADGWMRVPSRATRRVAALLAIGLAISSTLAVRHKMLAMVALGERTKLQTDFIVATASTLPSGARIALLYRADQVPLRPTFSSFRLPDCFCVRAPAADCLFLDRRPTLLAPENIRLRPTAPVHVLPDAIAVDDFDRSKADAVLYWDVPTARFTRLK